MLSGLLDDMIHGAAKVAWMTWKSIQWVCGPGKLPAVVFALAQM
jgi:hypothetical protein